MTCNLVAVVLSDIGRSQRMKVKKNQIDVQETEAHGSSSHQGYQPGRE